MTQMVNGRSSRSLLWGVRPSAAGWYSVAAPWTWNAVHTRARAQLLTACPLAPTCIPSRTHVPACPATPRRRNSPPSAPPPLPPSPPPSPPPPLTDECAALPDVAALGGELDGSCDLFCDVWLGSDRAGDYAEVDAFGFERGEPVVFQADSAELSAGCGPGIATAPFGWAGSGGWLEFDLVAGAPAAPVTVVDTYSTTAGTFQNSKFELRRSGGAGSSRGLNDGGAGCTLTLTAPRLCRAGPGAIPTLGEELNLDCALVGPIADEVATGACADTSAYSTLRSAVDALAANRATGDASCFSITRTGTDAAPQFELFASSTTLPKPGAETNTRTSYVLQCPPPPSPPPVAMQPRQCVTTTDGVTRCVQIEVGSSLQDPITQARLTRRFGLPLA